MKKPTNAYDALRDTLRGSNVQVDVYCQVQEFESRPRCHETVMAYDGDVGAFDPDSAERNLKRKGWVYRHNPDEYGFSQWVCPACINREVTSCQ